MVEVKLVEGSFTLFSRVSDKSRGMTDSRVIKTPEFFLLQRTRHKRKEGNKKQNPKQQNTSNPIQGTSQSQAKRSDSVHSQAFWIYHHLSHKLYEGIVLRYAMCREKGMKNAMHAWKNYIYVFW